MAANAVLQRAKQLAFETPEKKEVKLKDEIKSDTLTPSPPSAAKKPCSAFEKFVKKLPGDVSLIREMHEYVMTFGGEGEKVKPGAHPAEIVPFHLGSNNPENNSQHMKILELWFAGYQYKRSGMIYKSCASVVLDRSMDKDTLKLPITALKFTPPADGLPCVRDWIVCWESMLHGIDLGREPLSCNATFPADGDKLQLETCSLDIVKGWTKASVIAFVLLAAAEYDVEEHWSKLEPLVPFLDRAFLLPTYVMIDTTIVQQSFTNLQLSFRGAERQPPSALSLALQFSAVMRAKAEDGTHSSKLGTEDRLNLIIAEFHNHPGVIAKFHLDENKQKAVLHLLVGTTPETRAAMQAHLNWHKWKECSLSSELLKSSRWLLSAYPKNVKSHVKKLLTVTADVQEAFIENHIATFNLKTKRVKASVRCKHRPTVGEWDRMVDYTCVMFHAADEAAKFWSEDDSKKLEVVRSVHSAFMARDYFAEVQLCVESALPNWDVKHLSLWKELVDPVVDAAESVEDVSMLEETTAAAQFCEVKSKIGLDEVAWVKHLNLQNKKAIREHIISVTHVKAQNAIGQGIVERYMNKWCHLNLLGDLTNVPNLSAWLSQAATECKVKPEQLHVLTIVDFTKLGVATTGVINKQCTLLQKVLQRNPGCSAGVIIAPLLVSTSGAGSLRQDHRAIEDKCGNLGIALRDIRLGVDPGNLHGNSERPIYFHGWLCVADTTLPSKGTGHRRNRNDDPQDAVHLNTFIQSNLWKFQGFSLDSMPQGLPEADFAVPSSKTQFQSHDARRNLSDAQETSQWIAGVDVMTKLISHASVGDKKTAVIHTTGYCGAVEKACLGMGIPILSITDNQVYHGYTSMTVGNMLLEDWKAGSGLIGKMLPKFKADPTDETPMVVEEPEFMVCVLDGGKLTIPSTIRAQWIGDPIRAPEWRKLLKSFDGKWAEPHAGATQTAEVTDAPNGIREAAAEVFQWNMAFPGEPTTKADLDTKYGPALHSFAFNSELQGAIYEGPKLFVLASQDGEISADEPAFMFGAGTWLLDAKAVTFCQEHPEKGFEFELSSDQEIVVLEDNDGNDGPPIPVRSALQQVERTGLVDYEVAGHSCSRPAQVCQNPDEADRFEIGLKEGTKMIWKPAAVRLANVKVKNVGSYFEAQQILSSPALNQVWRLRSYVAEKSIGAAKPLIFVKEKLVLPAGQCQRLM